MIRAFRPEDGEALAALLHEDEVPEPVTGDGLRHWHMGQPGRAHARSWIGLTGDEIVGWARARLRWSTSVEGVGEVWAFVHPERRRTGLGARLYDEAAAHLDAVGGRVVESWSFGEDGHRFLLARGFRAERTEHVLRLDLATADTAALEPLRARREAEGYRLVPLAAVVDRPRELHALDSAATADVPQIHTEDDVRFEDWVEEVLGSPQLSRDGSFVVLAGERPVAYAFIEVDPPARLAANEMTGTSPEHRRRGLARLAKLATIAWAREQGLGAILTGSDATNVGMLGLNRSLGYRPVATERAYLKD
ncbi:MAG: GNAT family N-acetyltransferase [Gaiellaceae bacterium]